MVCTVTATAIAFALAGHPRTGMGGLVWIGAMVLTAYKLMDVWNLFQPADRLL